MTATRTVFCLVVGALMSSTAGCQLFDDSTHSGVARTPRSSQSDFQVHNTPNERQKSIGVDGVPSMSRKGTIKWFNTDKGFGFITPAAEGRDVFVQSSAVRGNYHDLEEGQKVEYELRQGNKGPEASDVRPL